MPICFCDTRTDKSLTIACKSLRLRKTHKRYGTSVLFYAIIWKSFWISHRSDFPTENISIHEKDYDLILSVLELEPKYRIPIHLFYYEGYSIKEISAILHEKEATIGTRLDRARKKLKDKLGSDYYGS